MRLLPLLAGVLLVACAVWSRPALAQRAIVLVRHAEKVDESRDPPLSPAGQARAASLARALRDIGVTEIYATEYERTKKTAAPLASALKIAPKVIPAKERDRLVKEIKARKNTGVVLIVGHSDTVPEILSALGVPGPAISIASAEYDNLFIVVPQAGSPPTFLRLRF